jgi:hypothetical protein
LVPERHDTKRRKRVDHRRDAARLDRGHRVLGPAPGRAERGGLERDVGGIDLLGRRDADGVAQPALGQTGPERRRLAVLGVGGHAAEHRPGGPDPVDLLQGEAPLGLERDGQRNPGAQTAVGVVRPSLGQEQAQPDAHRHLAPGQGERDQDLAVGRLAELTAILVRHADRLAPLLDQGRVVDRQDGVGAADEFLGLADEFDLQRLRPPARGRDEVVELLEGARGQPVRDRLDALALARPQQPLQIDRCPVLLGGMPEMVKERGQPVR